MCSNDNAFRTHASDTAAYARRTVATLMPHDLENVRVAEVGAVPDCTVIFAIEGCSREEFPVFRAVDDALDVAVHARGQVGGVAR